MYQISTVLGSLVYNTTTGVSGKGRVSGNPPFCQKPSPFQTGSVAASASAGARQHRRRSFPCVQPHGEGSYWQSERQADGPTRGELPWSRLRMLYNYYSGCMAMCAARRRCSRGAAATVALVLFRHRQWWHSHLHKSREPRWSGRE